MKSIVIAILLLTTSQLFAQKIVEKHIQVETISRIYIDGTDVFNIAVETAITDQIYVKASMEGEDNEHLVLSSDLKSGELRLSVKWQPFYKGANDKLSAHKVKSISLQLMVPEFMNVSMFSDIANATVKGKMEELVMELTQGHCDILVEANVVNIKTIDGHINVSTQKANIDATAVNGEISGVFKNSKTSKWRLFTIHGNININKSQ